MKKSPWGYRNDEDYSNEKLKEEEKVVVHPSMF
jgi:hypothetical protein